MCEYLGIGQTKARELLSNPANGFTVRIGNRLYAHKGGFRPLVTESDSFINKNTEEFQNENSIFETD